MYLTKMMIIKFNQNIYWRFGIRVRIAPLARNPSPNRLASMKFSRKLNRDQAGPARVALQPGHSVKQRKVTFEQLGNDLELATLLWGLGPAGLRHPPALGRVHG